jgi:hypothetical protein
MLLSVRTQSKTISRGLSQWARVVALGGMAAAALLAQQPASRIIFADNFTPGPSPLWNNYAGLWTTSGGQYYAQVPNNTPLTYTGLPFILADYTLTVTTVDGDGGIWLRSDENDPYADYLLLVIGGDGYGDGLRGGTAGTSIYFATASQSVITQVDNVFTPGDTYTITVTARGSTYSVYINGSTTPLDTIVYSSFPVGQVGLYDDQPNTTTGGGFGTPTTFSSFSITGMAVPPVISALSPDSGAVGTKVKITGANIQLATAVSFSGTPAKFIQEYPSTEIVAIVPDLATTGPVEVTTQIGTATSKTSFTVLP